MRVDSSHRFDQAATDVEHYWRATNLLTDQLAQLPQISSIVLCGSLAKDDLVPGWSDIDLLVFLGPRGKDLAVLNAISDQVQSSQARIPVPLGLDLVLEDEFHRSGQLGGRPLMMTYEVAHYGRLLHGDWPLAEVSYTPEAQIRVEYERAPLIRAELHSWRRGWCRRSHKQRMESDWFFETAKVLLRILQVLTGPNLVSPIGAAVSLHTLRRVRPHHPLLLAMSRAVEIRDAWPTLRWTSHGREAEIDYMSRALQEFEP